MCLFVGSKFPRSHRKFRKPSYTFTGFHRWTHMYYKKQWGFTRGGIYPYLLLPDIFSFSCIQPCDPVGRCLTVPSPPNQTPNVVFIITMHSHPFHAMSPCICNMMFHFMPIPCHKYDECYMDNSTHAYHSCMMENYINQHKNFQTITHFMSTYLHTHISTSTSHHQSSNEILIL